MQRLVNSLLDKNIFFEYHSDYIRINNDAICEYIIIKKVPHPVFDFLYSVSRSSSKKSISLYPYSYLINIYILGFVSEK